MVLCRAIKEQDLVAEIKKMHIRLIDAGEWATHNRMKYSQREGGSVEWIFKDSSAVSLKVKIDDLGIYFFCKIRDEKSSCLKE